MSLYELNQKFGLQTANRDIKKLGLGDTSTPATNESRLFEESGKFILKVYDGTEWLPINTPTAAEILSLIKTVDGTGSGLDADKLDGNEGSYFATATHNHNSTYLGITAKAADADKLDNQDSTYFRNASNLNAGTVPPARLGNLVHDSSGSAVLYPEILCYHLGMGVQVVTFPWAFYETPYLVVGPGSSSGTVVTALYSITPSGFRKTGSPSADVIVIGRRTR